MEIAEIRLRVPYNIYGYFSADMCLLGVTLALNKNEAWNIFLGWPTEDEIQDARQLGNQVKQVDVVTQEPPYATTAECATCKANREAKVDPSRITEPAEALHPRSWVHAMRR